MLYQNDGTLDSDRQSPSLLDKAKWAHRRKSSRRLGEIKRRVKPLVVLKVKGWHSSLPFWIELLPQHRGKRLLHRHYNSLTLFALTCSPYLLFNQYLRGGVRIFPPFPLPSPLLELTTVVNTQNKKILIQLNMEFFKFRRELVPLWIYFMANNTY